MKYNVREQSRAPTKWNFDSKNLINENNIEKDGNFVLTIDIEKQQQKVPPHGDLHGQLKK